MGYLSDLGTGTVKDIDPVTGYPRDESGHLLQSISLDDGHVIWGWDEPGVKLANFTSPYGHLEFAIGSADDFYCYDYAVVNAGVRGKFIILHSVINSETGHYIGGAAYEVLPINTEEERHEAVRVASHLADCMNGTDEAPHDRRGWNQDDRYFVRAVAHELFKHRFNVWDKKRETNRDWTTAHSLRFGGKRIDSVVDSILDFQGAKRAAERKAKSRAQWCARFKKRIR